MERWMRMDEDDEDVGGPTFVFVLGGRNHD